MRKIRDDFCDFGLNISQTVSRRVQPLWKLPESGLAVPSRRTGEGQGGRRLNCILTANRHHLRITP